jgi:hypothetical protein
VLAVTLALVLATAAAFLFGPMTHLAGVTSPSAVPSADDDRGVDGLAVLPRPPVVIALFLLVAVVVVAGASPRDAVGEARLARGPPSR